MSADNGVLDKGEAKARDPLARKRAKEPASSMVSQVRSISPEAEAELAALPPNYGIYRANPKGPNPGWRVSMVRQHRKLGRLFYDYLYGSSEEARAMALAYRDAVVREVPPSSNLDRAMRTPRNASGITGVQAHYDKKGRLIGYEAQLTVRGTMQRRTFSLTHYSEADAKARAQAQREQWMAEAMFEFMVYQPNVRAAANTLFGEQLTTERWAPFDKAMLDETLRLIDARFDALRPFWLTLRLAVHPGSTLVLTISDGGLPAQKRKAVANFAQRDIGLALEAVRDKAVAFVRELFGAQVAARFIADHGAKFERSTFDLEGGLSIRERP